jgi:hypothetical protein
MRLKHCAVRSGQMTEKKDPTQTDRPYPSREGRLPRHRDEITPETLTGLLRLRYPEIEVKGFDVVDIVDSHTTKLRLALDLNAAGRELGIPVNVCLKSNLTDGVSTGDICEVEARFYHLLGNALDAPTPKVYYADWDGDGRGRGVVVMEDLAMAPGAFGHSLDELGVDGVAAGLESLARLHASLWDSPHLADRGLPRSMEAPRDRDLLLLMFNYIEINLGRAEYREFLPEWIYEDPERLARAYDELAALELEEPGPICVVHGDSHQGNSFLREDGERLWLDWQMARKGHPWRDVCYFAIGSLTVEERRKSGRELVEHYRQVLSASGGTGWGKSDDAWEQFARWPVYGMQAWLGNVDVWGQSSHEMVRRFFAAAEDLETIERLTEGRSPRRPVKLREKAAPIPEELKRRFWSEK